jgi:hypothetical protein
MLAIEITHQDLSISQLRAEAARTADAKQARRILAIAMVLERARGQVGGREYGGGRSGDRPVCLPCDISVEDGLTIPGENFIECFI